MRKLIYPGALILTLIGMGAVRGEYPFSPLGEKDHLPEQPLAAGPTAGPAANSTANSNSLTTMGQVSNWILFNRPGCCGPIGGSGPIYTEVYVRNGVSLPVEGPYFGHTLETGWMIQGGGRLLLFNQPRDAAWTVDLSLSNIYNHGQHSDYVAFLHNILVPGATTGSAINVPVQGVTVASLNRTLVNAGFGREWYLAGRVEDWCIDADKRSWTWRAGLDAGPSWGTAKLEMQELPHRTNSFVGAFAAIHSDLEIPFDCFALQLGCRVEWDYHCMDILQTDNQSHVQDLNLLFTLGVRF